VVAACLAISTLDVKGLEAARICHQAGAEMLRVIAGALPMPETALARTKAYVTDASANFDAAYDKLFADGFPVRGDREACRPAFFGASCRVRHTAATHRRGLPIDAGLRIERGSVSAGAP
jgi:hypothetical protein